MQSQMLRTNSMCINQIGRNWKEQQGFYRFVHNKKVTESGVLRQCLSNQLLPEQEEELLIISDTSQINLSHLKDSLKDDEGIGVLTDGFTVGYFFHGSLILNSKYEVKGISDVIMYDRPPPIPEESEYIKSRKRIKLPIEEKESYRWLLSVRNSIEYLKNPGRLTFINDREGDIYEVLDEINKKGSHFIIRSQHNRKLALEDGSTIQLREYLKKLDIQCTYEVEVPADDRGNKKRTAKLNLRYSKITLLPPNQNKFKTNFSPQIECYVVQAFEEIEEGQPEPENLINWVLLTNHVVESVEDAKQIIDHYSNRWCIEDVFRGMKNKGMKVDSIMLRSGKALRKLTIMGFDISATALKLRQSREGKNHIPIEEVFDEEQVQCMDQLCFSLEGKTEKQQNPHSKDSLAWAAWIIARLGGWKGYQSQRPPGIITMKNGLNKFLILFTGWAIRDS